MRVRRVATVTLILASVAALCVAQNAPNVPDEFPFGSVTNLGKSARRAYVAAEKGEDQLLGTADYLKRIVPKFQAAMAGIPDADKASLVKAVNRPGEAETQALGVLYSYYAFGTNGSAIQATQAANESQMHLQLIQIAQNARIIELLEKLTKK